MFVIINYILFAHSFVLCGCLVASVFFSAASVATGRTFLRSFAVIGLHSKLVLVAVIHRIARLCCSVGDGWLRRLLRSVYWHGPGASSSRP